ncbi:MAG: T9SS type A sorting domain-containing protein [Ignavibacterium sp.]|nr:T9SS type A sorting domain-containing protein [Ignavibacterium sp.]
MDSLNGWTSGGRPQKTTDGGNTWIEQTNTSIWNSEDVFFKNWDIGWIIKRTLNSSLVKTVDGGLNWYAVPEIMNAFEFNFFPNPNHWLISGTPQKYITEDGGVSWIDITNDVPAIFNNFKGLTDKLGFAVGGLGLVLRYDDTSYVPVELISFEGRTDAERIILYWATASELNNQGFYIEKSYDKIKWETIGFINGNGTTTETNYYSFIDRQVFNGEINYRLKQVDFDGTFTYSKMAEIYFNSSTLTFELFQNFPNPFNPKTNIKYSLPENDFVNISLYSILGDKVIELVNEEKQAGFYTLIFDASDLASGIYFYKMKTGSGFTSTKKLTIIK